MGASDFKARLQKIRGNTDAILDNMQAIADESARVADVAHNARETLDDLDQEFERKTSLKGMDVAFLFVATALQCGRIFLINKLTEIQTAGQGNHKEGKLHSAQSKILGRLGNGTTEAPRQYYAPLNQIITGRGVPYDATAYAEVKHGLFKGANHRFATLGHDPVLGLAVGTANILTNTITTVDAPLVKTNHVIYDAEMKNPVIGPFGSTAIALKSSANRIQNEPEAVAAALIKQIIHIGTDLYTPCGIQIPGANLVLSHESTEQLTKIISTGDVIKIGSSAGIALFINYIISIFHQLMYNEAKHPDRDLYAVRTKKIILYSNVIATSSNVIWVGSNVMGGNAAALKDLDIGGLLVLAKRLTTDRKFIRQVKQEFIFGQFDQMIRGEELQLKEIPE